jgi:hypothetical protein
VAPLDAPPPPDAGPVRAILSRRVGVERDRAGLVGAIDELHPLAFSTGPAAEPAFVGLLIAIAAHVTGRPIEPRAGRAPALQVAKARFRKNWSGCQSVGPRAASQVP